ncbi:MAG: YeeE/YedE family protein [Chromatiales bacterium]|jgi:hypothetical protein
MPFDDFHVAHLMILGTVFLCALITGVVSRTSNFCTMGAFADWVTTGSTGRMKAWMLAIAVAISGVVILEAFGLVNADNASPAYRSSELVWLQNLLGGFCFGIGMTLASGCGSKMLVRIGGGNLKSLVVVVVIALVAYYMANPFPGTDNTLYSMLFHDWIKPFALELDGRQDIGTLVAGEKHSWIARLVGGLALVTLLLVLIFRDADFRKQKDHMTAGLVIGVAVVTVWLVTSSIRVEADGEAYQLSSYVQNWEFLSDSDAHKPASSQSLRPQSFTIISPIGQAFGYAKSGFDNALLTCGLMIMIGIVLGSFLHAVIKKGFRVEWFTSFRDVVRHLLGAMLMGVGGVLAMGCTFGQAISGISTLSIGSFIAFSGIALGSVLTLKMQYYMIIYSGEASFTDSLIASLADLGFIPNSFRKLDPV